MAETQTLILRPSMMTPRESGGEMTTEELTRDAFRTVRILLVVGAIATTVALVALVWFNLADPAEGTTLYEVLGPVAAFSGITAGLSFAAAAIWASVRGLWSDMPTWVRVGVWVIIVALAIVGAVAGSSR